jgi:hypothetical protein
MIGNSMDGARYGDKEKRDECTREYHDRGLVRLYYSPSTIIGDIKGDAADYGYGLYSWPASKQVRRHDWRLRG